MITSTSHHYPECFPIPCATGVQCGSVVKCLTCNPGVLGSIHAGTAGFLMGVSLGKTLQSPILVLVKPMKEMNGVSCRPDK